MAITVSFVGLIIGLAVMRIALGWFGRTAVRPGEAVVVTRSGATQVYFDDSGDTSVPFSFFARIERVDLSVHRFLLGTDGQILPRGAQDTDAFVSVSVRVEPTTHAVLDVAARYGCTRASDRSTIAQVCAAAFKDAFVSAQERLVEQKKSDSTGMFDTAFSDALGPAVGGFEVIEVAVGAKVRPASLYR